MKKIVFNVYEKPKGKARPRVTTRGGYARAYTPKTTKDYEDNIKKAYLDVVDEDYSQYEKGVKILIKAFFTPPSSCAKKKQVELYGTDYLKKPDCDNIEKCILDALNGVAYKDDSQVCQLGIEKKYSNEEFISVNIYYE